MKFTKLLRLLALSTALLLLLSVFGCSSAGTQNSEPVEPLERGVRLSGFGVKEVATNDRFTLSIDIDFGTILLEDKLTGRTYRSNPENAKDDPLAKGMTRTNLRSQLLINVVDQKGNIDPYNSAADAIGENGFVVSRTENGVILDYNFKRVGITVPLVITLGAEGITARVLMNEVQETNEKYRLVSVGVLPYFGAGGPEDEGYVMLPDGSGALLRFNNGKTTYGYYNKPVYNNDAYESDQFGTKTGEVLMMPLFGMHYAAGNGKEAGFVATATEAAAMATLTSTPAGVNCSYTNAYFTFVYRTAKEVSVLSRTWAEKAFNMVSKYTATKDNPTIDFGFLSSDTAGYTDMARFVSGRLQELGATKITAKPSLVLDVYNSVVKLGYTLGIPHEKSSVITDFAQTEAILSDMKEHNVTLHLLGWDEYGAVGGSVRDDYDPAAVAGGKKGLEALLATAKRLGTSVYLEAEAARFTDGTFSYNALFHAATQITNKPIRVYEYRRSTNERNPLVDTYTLLSPQYLPTVVGNLVSALPAQGVNLSLGSINQYPYPDFGDEFYSREQTADTFVDILAQTAANRKLYGENPAWYALPYMNVASDVPFSSSEYNFFDQSVPFVQLVLRELMTVSTTSVNLSGEPQKVFLRAVETGTSLKFSFIGCAYEEIRDTRLNTLYGAEYALWKDEALRYQQELETALSGLDNVSIREHRQLTNTVVSVLYDNGTEILVNYGREDYAVGEDTVKALSWLRRDTTGGDTV